MTKWLRLGVIFALGATLGWAVDWKARYPKPEGYVSDFANAIDATSRSQLEAYCAMVEHSTGVQMALVTLPSLESEPIEDVTNTIYRNWGVGQKGKDEGIMMLLAIADRRTRLEVGYGLEPHLPDGMAGDILRAMRPALRQGDFGDAMMSAARSIGDVVAKAKNVQLQSNLPPPRVREKTTDQIPWPMILGGIVLVLALLRSNGPRGYGGGGGGILGGLPWLILGNMMGSRGSFGGRGSGGFGGPDSGDGGFGGFGGGDSGGGGASSDW